jgi:hypothetical protein
MVTLFRSLSRRVQENFGIIRAGVERGLKSPAINELVRAKDGRGLNKSALLEGMNTASGVRRAGLSIANVGMDRTPNYSRLPVFPVVSVDASYLIEYEIRWKDSVTGETGSSFITVATNETKTRLELDMDAQLGWLEGQSEERYGVSREIERIVPWSGRRTR